MILWSGAPSSIMVITPMARASQMHMVGTFSVQNTSTSKGSSSSARVWGMKP